MTRKVLTYDQFLRDSQLGESLDLSWGSKIFEIGDPRHAITPMDWELVDERDRVTDYIFSLNPSTDYLVKLTRTFDAKDVNVEFYANGDRDSVTNDGNPLTVMSTVIDIVKDYLNNNPDIESFSFVPAKADYDDDRRLKLYLRYIRGYFNRPRIIKEDFGGGYVSIKVILNRPTNESLTPHMKKSKFKVGQMVRAGRAIGKIYSYRNGEYLVLIGSDQRSFAESELKPVRIKK
jgi:hypothetical protein